MFAGHGKKKKKWQQSEDTEEAAAPQVPAGPKKEVPKPYMADAKYVTSEFRTTGNLSLHVHHHNDGDGSQWHILNQVLTVYGGIVTVRTSGEHVKIARAKCEKRVSLQSRFLCTIQPIFLMIQICCCLTAKAAL